ncbi:hypothetical protein OG749_01310 [Streptomyces nojiriensis]|uniref:hypothetical protein n=1 Tax=Streptomyces nojiriensis TaxID=66374 RepID=UPI002E18A708
MDIKPACGPERDPEFFEEIDKLFARYPEAAERYAVSCLRLETVVLKVDFEKQVGVTRVEDGRIITEFYDREDEENVPKDLFTHCCRYTHKGCVHLCVDDM